MTVKIALNMLLLLTVLPTLVVRGRAPRAHAQQSSQVGLVVGFGDGSYATECISFTNTAITGYDVLMRSDLDVSTNGGAICQIEETGCPPEDCFCSIPDYWSYWHLDKETETWKYSTSGARSVLVHDGDVEGWSWGPEPPPALPFHHVCSLPSVYLPVVTTVGG